MLICEQFKIRVYDLTDKLFPKQLDIYSPSENFLIKGIFINNESNLLFISGQSTIFCISTENASKFELLYKYSQDNIIFNKIRYFKSMNIILAISKYGCILTIL